MTDLRIVDASALAALLFGGPEAEAIAGRLAGRDPHHTDCVADHIGGATFASGPLGMWRSLRRQVSSLPVNQRRIYHFLRPRDDCRAPVCQTVNGICRSLMLCRLAFAADLYRVAVHRYGRHRLRSCLAVSI